MKVNLELSEKYSRHSMQSQCYQNSLILITKNDYFNEAKYLEGWCVLTQHTMAIQHGWLELNNEIIDVTLPGKVEKYFPCDSYTKQEAIEQWEKARRVTPLFEKYYGKGKGFSEIWHTTQEEVMNYCNKRLEEVRLENQIGKMK